MTDYIKAILLGQFEAALCMLRECIEKCPPAHWEAKIANDTFRQVAYHTLFYVDFYLSPSESAFVWRDLHTRGGNERSSTEACIGLSREESLAYVEICRQKLRSVLPNETSESLQGPSGFSWLPFTRGEVHLYNIRHMQHHTGQLSASLRKVVEAKESWWVRTGWR